MKGVLCLLAGPEVNSLLRNDGLKPESFEGG